MEEKKLVPKLRFPGFTEPWEQRKLGDLADGVFGGGTPKTSIDTYWNGSIPWIQSSNLMDDKIENFINDKSITNLAIKESATKLIPANSIAIVTRVGVGKVALIREKFATSQDFLSFYCRHEHNSLFMAYQISRLMKVKSRLLQGTSIKGITKSEVLESEVLIPKGAEEETKIADFLSSCDTLITLHQRKLEHLKLKKKSLLQKLFPKEGEVYPELRFPGFTDPWEQRKLGDFTNQISTSVNPEDAKLPLWSLTAEAGLIEKTDRYERDFLVKKKDQFKRIETNTLVYNPMNITIGSIDIYTGRFPIAVSGYYVSIVYDKTLDTDFLKEILLLPSSLKMYKNYATGSLIERQRVQYHTFSKLQFLFPTLEEQRTIGRLFKSLNLIITLHQRKLEHLQLLKKALLQQLFV